MDNVRKNIAITTKLNDMAEEIREKKGLKTFVSVVELAINELHSRTFKDYVQQRILTGGKTPEEKAEQQIKIQELKDKRKEDGYIAIAEALNGKIISLDGGEKRVTFFIYDKNSRYKQEVPLEMMTDELVENQYYPSREDIEKRQAEGKVNYNPKNWD